ncbi:DUF2244 domain-containing protein [Pararobbsia silviterrae]|uniref:DUF2244 domain-containing protein n=1 Tax=Pararobbsia silviterrae TaxID=1792498 RepID=A0A494YFH6_9BURK|nr:DUF2244 domain-containing protein [Pararobbsia silviterrae]RKP58797.1 DUF2244 domain-containing protein [Pararobbsia silviterrae]
MYADSEGVENEPVLKDWMLKRNCSVSPKQFFVFYVGLCLVSLSIALTVVYWGAWLVLPFTGLDLLVVGVAFVIYARHAVDYEYIRLCEHRLVIERVSADRVSQYEFNPRWVRVEPGATPRDRITLHSAGQSVTIGQHLAWHLRSQFANELRSWLRRCA